MGEAKIFESDGFIVTTERGHSPSQQVSEVFKSNPSASRFITAYAVLVVAVCFVGCSTKSQLVGTWSNDALSKSMGGQPNAMAEIWEFRSDNTCRMQHFTSSGNCKYAVLDNGRVKIEFQGGQKAEGKIEAGILVPEKLILEAFGEKPSVLFKW